MICAIAAFSADITESSGRSTLSDRCGKQRLELFFVKFYPFRVRSYKTGIRSLRQERNEFERVSIWVTKIDLCRWHPAYHARLGRELAAKPGRFDPASIQLHDAAPQLFE